MLKNVERKRFWCSRINWEKWCNALKGMTLITILLSRNILIFFEFFWNLSTDFTNRQTIRNHIEMTVTDETQIEILFYILHIVLYILLYILFYFIYSVHLYLFHVIFIHIYKSLYLQTFHNWEHAWKCLQIQFDTLRVNTLSIFIDTDPFKTFN